MARLQQGSVDLNLHRLNMTSLNSGVQAIMSGDIAASIGGVPCPAISGLFHEVPDASDGLFRATCAMKIAKYYIGQLAVGMIIRHGMYIT